MPAPPYTLIDKVSMRECVIVVVSRFRVLKTAKMVGDTHNAV